LVCWGEKSGGADNWKENNREPQRKGGIEADPSKNVLVQGERIWVAHQKEGRELTETA